MQIQKVTFRNFGSYGNKTHTLEIPSIPGFWLIQGKNGNGKCLSPETQIKILVNPEEAEKFQNFLELYRSKEK
jgi:hypothetical protein